MPGRLIRIFAFVGDTILDPFLGSGTTSLAARNLDRNSVSYEINEGYISKIKDKLKVNQPELLGLQYVFLKDSIKSDLNKEIEKLSYIFKYQHKLDKKLIQRNYNSALRLIMTEVGKKNIFPLRKLSVLN